MPSFAYYDDMNSHGRRGDTLTDSELRSEIELVGNLVAAAGSYDGPMAQGDIDRLLGVSHRRHVTRRRQLLRTAV